MDPVIKKAYEASLKGQSYAFATIIDSTLKGTPRKSGAKMVVLEDGSIFGTIGGGRNEKAATLECQKVMKTLVPTTVTYDYFGQKGQSVCGGQINVFIEPFAGQKHFIICGAGHIALPLSVLAKMLNFKVTILDNRPEFANNKRFPHVDHILVGNHTEKLSRQTINENTYFMIVTQGNEYDFECLKTIVQSNAGYIGVISSQPKRIKFFKRLKNAGVAEKHLNRVKIPAGLDIGSQTPEEIAVSIMAEVVSLQRKTFVGSSKFKEKSKSKEGHPVRSMSLVISSKINGNGKNDGRTNDSE